MSLKACAVMSIGLREVANGRWRLSVACASSVIGATSSPALTAASAIWTPTPPEIVIKATQRLWGNTPNPAAYATSSISSVLWAR